jgi:hypothetical protein
MIGNSLLLFIASVALAQTGIGTGPYDSIPSQGKVIMAGSASLGNLASIRYKTTITGASNPAGGSSGGVMTGSDLVHRFMVRQDGSYFGYDLVLGPGDAVNGFQISFQPLTIAERHLQSMAHGKTLVPMPLPQYPPPQIVHDGDIVALDLMVSADGTQKLTDYIQFFAETPEPQAAGSTAAARDFTLDDGPVHLQVAEARFFVDGQPYRGGAGFQTRSGSTFWFAIPNQGRYILSLAPHDGFTQNGEVRDNVIRFEDAGHQYELRTLGKIAGAGGAFHLYMRHDLPYQPKPGNENRITGGVDRLENLLPNP